MLIDNSSLGSWREFGRCYDANAWRKSTKEADNTQIFFCNLEMKSHHGLASSHHSHQRSSERSEKCFLVVHLSMLQTA